LADNHNQLIDKGFPVIRGWTVVLFLAVLAALLVPAVWLVRDRGMVAVITVFFAVSLLAVAAAVAPMGRNALPALGFRAAGWRPIVLGTLATAALSFAVSQVGLEPQGMKEAVKIAREPALFAASLLLLAGLAPLVEELVFRGLIYGWLANRWGSVVAWIASSLAFAAAHVELAHVILVLPLGLWFGWLRWRTNSLWPSLVAHVVNNGLAIAAAALLDA